MVEPVVPLPVVALPLVVPLPVVAPPLVVPLPMVEPLPVVPAAPVPPLVEPLPVVSAAPVLPLDPVVPDPEVCATTRPAAAASQGGGLANAGGRSMPRFFMTSRMRSG